MIEIKIQIDDIDYGATAKAIISKMPKGAKDDLIVRALEANKDKLSSQLEQLGRKNGMIFKITDSSVEKK